MLVFEGIVCVFIGVTLRVKVSTFIKDREGFGTFSSLTGKGPNARQLCVEIFALEVLRDGQRIFTCQGSTFSEKKSSTMETTNRKSLDSFQRIFGLHFFFVLFICHLHVMATKR